MARVLEHPLTSHLERNHQRPRARPHRWIVEGDVVLERILRYPPELLDGVQLVSGTHPSGVGHVVGRVHDQRVAVPSRARVTVVLPEHWRDVRRLVCRKDARVVNHLAAQRDDARALRDLEVALITGADVRCAIADAARAQRQVTGPIRRSSALLGRGLRACALRRARCESRDPAVGWIDDQAMCGCPTRGPTTTSGRSCRPAYRWS